MCDCNNEKSVTPNEIIDTIKRYVDVMYEQRDTIEVLRKEKEEYFTINRALTREIELLKSVPDKKDMAIFQLKETINHLNKTVERAKNFIKSQSNHAEEFLKSIYSE